MSVTVGLAPSAGGATDRAHDPAQDAQLDLEADWLATFACTTARTYRGAIAHFATWVGCHPTDVPRQLLGTNRGHAVRTTRLYRAAMLAEGLAPATINLRLTALRSLVAVGRAIGVVEWVLEVPSVRAERNRDTRGPGLAGARAMLTAATGARGGRLQCRDILLIRLLMDLGLRRAEVAGVTRRDVEYDLDGNPCALQVLAKGHRQRTRIALPLETARALTAWLAFRQQPAGRLLGLTPRGVAKAVARIGQRAGIKASPHDLRRASITAALDATAGDVRRVRLHSRHAHVSTVIQYDQARDDGSVSRLVAALL